MSKESEAKRSDIKSTIKAVLKESHAGAIKTELISEIPCIFGGRQKNSSAHFDRSFYAFEMNERAQI